MSAAFVPVKPDYAYPEKRELLEALYDFVEEEAARFEFVCRRGCSHCCTTHLWLTSLEARYLRETLAPELEERLLSLSPYPRPGSTPNTMALFLMRGKDPPPDYPAEVKPCPLLTDEGLCAVYPRRPLTCRLMFSLRPCAENGEAEVPPDFLGLSSLLFQLVEEVDVGGVYGHLSDQVRFLRDLEAGTEEVPEWLLGNREAPDLAYSPEEEYLRGALSRLYRRKLPSGKTFKELLDEIKEGFGPREALSFLDEIL
ncbi:YkgJ family cysteine cluster protein [Thermosulfurimonas sp. F29]|uniref:YkgJ family cysteine cluster protein n=1 Tax=Thermosulfurimonas sp. F29 TaxID=2867247 RepID=UPI001C83EB2E|nr:YkgJ family cysteine cluster protein [Thermosulfurimonas sp. F29]MBX6423949.1 YkgJ family cysteine cluster protein [Thermosulfurimonas sp. F29]